METGLRKPWLQRTRKPRGALTHRELQVANLLARGLPNKRIAQSLNISQFTVSSHLRRMYAKFDVHTRAELVGKLRATFPIDTGDRGSSVPL